jgi:hypothetical protein
MYPGRSRRLTMAKPISRLILFLVAASFLNAPAFAAFELRATQKIDVGSKALDTAVSQDGKWTFVLTTGGVIRVLSWNGQQVQTIETGGDYERVEFSEVGTRLILSGGSGRDVLIVALDLIHTFDTSGSPSKGPKNAPVEIAYFSDFQ